jgi:hypothetical protein
MDNKEKSIYKEKDINKKLEEYINSLSKQEVETMELAKKLLTSSFDLKKSNAFLKWYNSSS